MRLALIMTAQSLITYAIGFADNVMVGAYSESALTGVAMANQIQYLFSSITSGIGAAGGIFISQYWGKGENGPIRTFITLTVRWAFAVGIVFFAVMSLWPRQVLLLFTDSPAALAEGMRYIHYIRFSYVLFALTNAFVVAIRGARHTVVAVCTSLSTLGINIVLNYALIYGNFGAPEMGAAGAALATLVSRCVEFIIVVCYICICRNKLCFEIRDLALKCGEHSRRFFQTVLPMVMNGLLWGAAQLAQTAILGHADDSALAANSMAMVLFEVTGVYALSCSNAAAVVTGNAIGEGDMDALRRNTRSLQLMFFINGLIASAVINLVCGAFLSLYTLTPQTRRLASSFIRILSVTMIGTCYEYPVEIGIIQSGGHSRYALVVDTLFLCCVDIPLACLSAFVWHLPATATFFFIKIDQLLKCIPNSITVNRYGWVRKMTEKDGNFS